MIIPKKVPDVLQPDLAAMDVEVGTDSAEPKSAEETPIESSNEVSNKIPPSDI